MCITGSFSVHGGQESAQREAPIVPAVHAAMAAHVHGIVAPPIVITVVPTHAELTIPQPNAAAPQQAALHADPLERFMLKWARVSTDTSTSADSVARAIRVDNKHKHAMAIPAASVMASPSRPMGLNMPARQATNPDLGNSGCYERCQRFSVRFFPFSQGTLNTASHRVYARGYSDSKHTSNS